MSNDKQVIFKFKKDGKASFEIKGIPGEACLDAKNDVTPILDAMGSQEINTEATDEMHVHAGKPSEAHNNV